MSDTKKKVRLLISSCLLGHKTRYDGNDNEDLFLKNVAGRYIEWIPICPEVEMGLPVPREPLRLVESGTGVSMVTRERGIDLTERINSFSLNKIEEINNFNICGAVFKSRSPSCGYTTTKIYNVKGNVIAKGNGLFVQNFIEKINLIPLEDDGRLRDDRLRENFFMRVFLLHRWKSLLEKGLARESLLDFHLRVKLILMAHSISEYRNPGRMLSNLKGKKLEDIADKYISILMKGLSKPASPARHANVLYHIMGYFKKELDREDREELIGVIEDYRKGYTGISAPLVLIRHYIRKYNVEYLKRQFYLEPLPFELRLRD